MTNEEAFRKWRTDYESDYDKKPSYLEVWQAAISYMQEQSEPVTYLKFYSYESGLDRQEGFEEVSKHTEGAFPVYTTPQRQQPLKRLSKQKLWKLYDGSMGYVNYGNEIMDDMQEINK